MAHQYSRVGFKSSVEVNDVNLSLSYGGVDDDIKECISIEYVENQKVSFFTFTIM